MAKEIHRLVWHCPGCHVDHAAIGPAEAIGLQAAELMKNPEVMVMAVYKEAYFLECELDRTEPAVSAAITFVEAGFLDKPFDPKRKPL